MFLTSYLSWKNSLRFHYSVSDNINHFDCSGMACFSTVASDSLVIRLSCFVDLTYKINGHAFSQSEHVSMVVLDECFCCGAMITVCLLPPASSRSARLPAVFEQP